MSDLSSADSDKSLFSTSAVGLKTNLEVLGKPSVWESNVPKEVGAKREVTHFPYSLIDFSIFWKLLYFAGRKVEQAYVALLGGDSALDDTDFPLGGDGLGLNFLHELDQGFKHSNQAQAARKRDCKPFGELHLVSTWLDVMFLWMQIIWHVEYSTSVLELLFSISFRR